MPITTKANLINTEVFSEAVTTKLGDALRLQRFLYTQNFENEQAGSIHVPRYNFLGDALVYGEGVPIPTDLLTQDTEALDIIKVGKAVELTDEAMKSGYGDPIGEAENQLVRSVANGIENQIFTALAGATLTYANPDENITGDSVLNATALFGEEYDVEGKALVINPVNLSSIRRDANFQDNKLYDVEIIVSNRVPEGSAFLLVNGAIGLYQSSQVSVETDRDILAKTTVLSSSAHFATHIRDMSKVVRITLPAPV